MQAPFNRSLFYLILLVYGMVIGTVLITDQGIDLAYTALRLAALLGYLSLSLAVIMNLFKPDLQRLIGWPFLPVHHTFAVLGLVLITIHPVLFFILTADPSVFIPDTTSISSFFASGGRVAIILIYGAFLAALFRSALASWWRKIHMLVYPALIIAVIHANIMGATFQNAGIWLLYNGLAGAILITGIMKGIRRRKIRL